MMWKGWAFSQNRRNPMRVPRNRKNLRDRMKRKVRKTKLLRSILMSCLMRRSQRA
jgi:hypothetical protein